MNPLPLLLSLAVPAFAGTHRLSVRVSHGKTVWTDTVIIGDREQKRYVGKVGGRSLVVTALAAVGNTRGPAMLQYHIKVDSDTSKPEPLLVVQGEAWLRLGDPVQVASCGPWTLELGLDSKGARARSGFGGSDGNLRLTAEFERGAEGTICRLVLGGEHVSLADPRNVSFFTMAASVQRTGETVLTRVQLVHSPPGGTMLQVEKEAALAFGKKTALSGTGYQLSLRVEGNPGAAAPIDD